jgi:hypothetical protein
LQEDEAENFYVKQNKKASKSNDTDRVAMRATINKPGYFKLLFSFFIGTARAILDGSIFVQQKSSKEDYR